jgi:exopolyphosphatase / guanosine-5'-triphosphate,3'-diphosphate pyrophosphatase
VTRVAAIDCGTNSLRLLVADVSDGRLWDVVRRMEVVRLGQGVDRTGRLDPQALERTSGVLAEYAAECSALEVKRLRMVATSATRDAANRAEFVAEVQAILGAEPEVLTGGEEAALSFLGATRELAGSAEVAAPYLVVDIGGGSTEFVLGTDSAEASISTDVGCVRLTERHFAADPPTTAQVAAATADIEDALVEVRQVIDPRAAVSLIGLAGTVTTVAGIALDLPSYDPDRIHHSRLPAGSLHRISAHLLTAGHDERAAIPVMHPGRVDVIAAGALILDVITQRFGFDEVVVSEHDILDGIAWSCQRAVRRLTP